MGRYAAAPTLSRADYGINGHACVKLAQGDLADRDVAEIREISLPGKKVSQIADLRYGRRRR